MYHSIDFSEESISVYNIALLADKKTQIQCIRTISEGWCIQTTPKFFKPMH